MKKVEELAEWFSENPWAIPVVAVVALVVGILIGVAGSSG